MTDLEGDFQRAVQSFEDLQRDLLKAEASAFQAEGEVMASGLFAMRYTATLMMRQLLDFRHSVKSHMKKDPGTHWMEAKDGFFTDEEDDEAWQ